MVLNIFWQENKFNTLCLGVYKGMEWNEKIIKEWNGMSIRNINECNGMELSYLVWMF